MRAIASSFRNLYRQSLEERTAALHPRTRTELARDVQQSTSAQVDELQQVNNSIEQAQLALEELEKNRHFVSMRLAAYQEKLDQQAKRLRRAEERLHGVVLATEEDESSMQEETRPLAKSKISLRDPTSQGVVVDTVGELEEQEVEDDDENDSTTLQDDGGTGDGGISIEELERQKQLLQNNQEALKKVHRAHDEMKASALQLQRKILILERKREEIMVKTRECRDFLVVAAQIEQQAEDGDTVHLDDDLEEGPFSQIGADDFMEGSTSDRRVTQSRDVP